ncbi:MAG: DNA mismatch repair protein MutL, partial [Treponema sp.]|nr:DNA mismatch repair protein MutL [Treponema sp.]
ATTLGFRGEALAAAAAIAKLEIISSTGQGEAWFLETGPGMTLQLSGVARTRGSTVRALNLYDAIPARKKFLKREGSEGTMCRQAFIEKALAFPQISFRFKNDGRIRDFFPKAESKKNRFADALLDVQERAFLHEIHVFGNGFSVDAVIGGPEIFRSDRRNLFVFANGRRIQEYSMMQAMEYGVQGCFPNGTHPVGAVFINIDPALADFNIHPAKREVRFRDSGAVHHAISSGLRDYFRRFMFKNAHGTPHYSSSNETALLANNALHDVSANQARPFPALQDSPNIANFYQAASALKTESDAAEEAPVYGEIKYAGRIFDLFILVEWGQRLFIIDQHAAHERILYNNFLANKIVKQDLLVPITFNTESSEEDNFLDLMRNELDKMAIVIEKNEDGWCINALPAGWNLSDAETVREILGLRNAKENMAERWAATLSCHQAIKDNDFLDEASALALAKDALALPDPKCPHGRPLWTVISKKALCHAVKRN